MPDNMSPTTEIKIAGDNQTIVDLLHQQYGRLEAGEARTALEASYSPVWNEDEFTALFEVESMDPPYAHVVRRDDKKRGTAMYLDAPRFYFLFNPEKNDG
jgi:hypothetical protein